MQQEDTYTDLVSLYNDSPLTEDTIIDLLAKRYQRKLPYTQIGDSTLIVINPYQQLDLVNDATLESYAEIGYKDLSFQKPLLQPHVYDLAIKVYFHMRRTGEDQNIILSGITGSGKSTTRNHLLSEILYVSSHNKKTNKQSLQIKNASTVIEIFGHARTVQNTSASKFGLFQEIQFNERGRILGAKTLLYQFDKSRMTHVPTNERTFHIFYALLAGTTVEEKNALHINYKPEYFNYLNKTLISTCDWNDEIKFSDLKSALKICGFKTKTVTHIFQLLAAILHLGNLHFMESTESLAQEACVVKNTEILDMVAALLGVSPTKLETCLTYKLKMIGKEVCTIFLNPQAASNQRDDLASALYYALFLWIVESINRKVCYSGEPANVIGIMDQFGFQNFQTNNFQEFCVNLANEHVHHFIFNEYFNNEHGQNSIMLQDGIPIPFIQSIDNVACLELLLGNEKNQPTEDTKNQKQAHSNSSALKLGGIVGLMDRDSAKLQSGATDATDANFLASLERQFSNHPSISCGSQTYSFGIHHFSGTVHYTVDMFLERNLDDLSPDFVNMLKDNSSNLFISNLFDTSFAMTTESHPKDVRTIVKAQLTNKPTRAPTLRRKPTKRVNPTPENEKQLKLAEDAYKNMEQTSVINQLYTTLRDITFSISKTKVYNIIHLRPNDTQIPEFDHHRISSQIRAFYISDIIVRQSFDYATYYSLSEFETRYEFLMQDIDPDLHVIQRLEYMCAGMNWTSDQVFIGHDYVWLKYQVWKGLEDSIRAAEKEEKEHIKNMSNNSDMLEVDYPADGELPLMDSENMSFVDKQKEDVSQWGEESEWGLAEGFRPNMDMSNMIEGLQAPKIENIEQVPITAIRRWWVRFVWLMTWWIPSILLKWLGKMKRPEIQMAWREKVTLCMIIFFFSAFVIFIIVGLGPVMCPGTKYMYSSGNVQVHNVEDDNYMSVRGVVYDLTTFAKQGHGTTNFDANADAMVALAGMDVSSSIPPPLTVACSGLVTSNIVRIIPNTTVNAQASFIHYSGDQVMYEEFNATMGDSHWYWNTFLPAIKDYKKGTVVHLLNNLKSDADSWGRYALAINNRVYDLSDYFSTLDVYGPTQTGYDFFSSTVTDLFKRYRGTDATEKWQEESIQMTPEEQEMNMNCLDNYFYIGDVDPRQEARCTFANYMLLACACLMCAVMFIKFLAALQFGSTPTPEDPDKFVICQVPCYTEDEQSLKKTIDSLTVMKYDDKRKLLFLIADGMVMGSGNDRPTPRILLDILGYDVKNDPEPLMFKSIGEGSKQLNYGKVYSGLYECEGHIIPYLVVAKVGKASERAKPGNRGKRDSQMIVMNFLNRVHFDNEMTPMELEIYHQIKNVIGVCPSFYEYVLMVDSDTEVMPDSLSYLVSSMLHDAHIMGICGETALANEKQSWITMIQVYEYYISHYLAKAFESLFGSVTCLPGCFCMYRIRTPKHEPLIISPKVVHDYSENIVDTLHKKNLLSLGEDRYLTTLMMKHFPKYKMKFTSHASCRTVAPDKWKVLLSQRRRWINSTIHNLLEVVLLSDLCGFCLFSMRFVVLVDLIGTLTLPVSFVYLVYLIYVIAADAGPFPKLAMGMLVALYALQVVLFILKREWQHIGWMFFYLLALPVYAFLLPIYSFWHFDDFSWGNTRIVVEENQRKIIATDEEKFDDKMIPMKKWSVYEQELWEMGSRSTKIMYQDYDYCRSSFTSGTTASVIDRTMSDYYMAPIYNPDMMIDSRNSVIMSNAPCSPVMYPRKVSYSSNHSAADLLEIPMAYDVPTDDEIAQEIKNILSTADLMLITKRQVREQLSNFYGCDMSFKKDFINACIDHILQGQL